MSVFFHVSFYSPTEIQISKHCAAHYAAAQSRTVRSRVAFSQACFTRALVRLLARFTRASPSRTNYL